MHCSGLGCSIQWHERGLELGMGLDGKSLIMPQLLLTHVSWHWGWARHDCSTHWQTREQGQGAVLQGNPMSLHN